MEGILLLGIFSCYLKRIREDWTWGWREQTPIGEFLSKTRPTRSKQGCQSLSDYPSARKSKSPKTQKKRSNSYPLIPLCSLVLSKIKVLVSYVKKAKKEGKGP